MTAFSDDEVRAAMLVVLPPGWKPEDYLHVDESLPLWIAREVVRELVHRRQMAEAEEQLRARYGTEAVERPRARVARAQGWRTLRT